ncbi:hypothetical protein BH23GEM2_BH23GEM2_14890 [soil metagenome]
MTLTAGQRSILRDGRLDVARKALARFEGRDNGESYVTAERVLSRSETAEPMPRRLHTLREWSQRGELLVRPADRLPFGLARAGRATLVAAREKTGKTTLVNQGIAELSHGGVFLGERLKVARTLLYTIDEPVEDTIQRLLAFGADLDNVIVCDESPTAAMMRDEIRAVRADVVVIDTLPELWRGKVKSANDAEEVSAFLRPYILAAREAQAALTLLYHTSKAGREYRGSIDIGATVDIPLTFRRPNTPGDSDPGGEWDEDATDDGRRLLRGTGRGVKVDVRLSFDGARYSLGAQPMPLRQRILRELARDPASGTALADMINRRKADVLEALRGMAEAGEARNKARVWELTPVGRQHAAAETIGSATVPGHLTPHPAVSHV